MGVQIWHHVFKKYTTRVIHTVLLSPFPSFFALILLMTRSLSEASGITQYDTHAKIWIMTVTLHEQKLMFFSKAEMCPWRQCRKRVGVFSKANDSKGHFLYAPRDKCSSGTSEVVALIFLHNTLTPGPTWLLTFPAMPIRSARREEVSIYHQLTGDSK